MLIYFFFSLASYKGTGLGTGNNLPTHEETPYKVVYSTKTQFTADN